MALTRMVLLSLGFAGSTMAALEVATAHAQARTATVAMDRGSMGGFEISEGVLEADGDLLRKTAIVRSRVLLQGDPSDRAMAIDRLVAATGREALDVLLTELLSGPSAKDEIAVLKALRGLRDRLDLEEVRAFYKRSLRAAQFADHPSTQSLVQDTAAWALAERGTPDCLDILADAGLRRGRGVAAARRALLAAPPRDLERLLFQREKETLEPAPPSTDEGEVDREPTTAKAPPRWTGFSPTAAPETFVRVPRRLYPSGFTFLGDLGDLRAIATLREGLTSADRPTRAAAALALTKLGQPIDLDEVALWGEDQDPRFVLAAAEVLIAHRDPRAVGILGRAVTFRVVRKEALALAPLLQDPRLASAIAPLEPEIDAALRPLWASALVAVDPKFATDPKSPLIAKLKDPELAPAIMTALGRREEVLPWLESTFASEDLELRRAAVLIAEIYVATYGKIPRGMSEAVAALADGPVKVSAKVALGVPLGEVVPSEAEPTTLAHAALAAVGLGRSLMGSPLESAALAITPDTLSLLEGAGAVSFADREVRAALPRAKLDAWLDGPPAVAPLAAEVFAARATFEDRERVLRLLRHPDVAMRVAMARGLGVSTVPQAIRWLERAYEAEIDLRARVAFADAVHRHDSGRAVAMTAGDPSGQVRGSARYGAPPLTHAGASVLHLELAGRGPVLARLLFEDGSVRPVWVDRSGPVILFGLPESGVEVEFPVPLEAQ